MSHIRSSTQQRASACGKIGLGSAVTAIRGRNRVPWRGVETVHRRVKWRPALVWARKQNLIPKNYQRRANKTLDSPLEHGV